LVRLKNRRHALQLIFFDFAKIQTPPGEHPANTCLRGAYTIPFWVLRKGDKGYCQRSLKSEPFSVVKTEPLYLSI
jgi:hypothetical protein